MSERASLRRLLIAAAVLAVAFTSIRSRAEPQGPPGGKPAPKRPSDEVGKRFMIYDDRVNHFIPGGYMPDGRGVQVDAKCDTAPFAGDACLRISYRLDDNPWVGVAFLLDNQWEPRRKFDLYDALGARQGDRIVLRLYARSADGAAAKFQVAGLKRDAQALPVQSPWVRLGKDWQLVEIDLSRADLSSLHGALSVVLDREHNAELDKPVVQMDLDQVYFSRTKSSPRPDRK